MEGDGGNRGQTEMGKREKMTEERKRSDSQCCATRRKNAPELCPPLQKKKK